MSTTSPTLRRPAKTGESGLSGSTALWIGIVFSFAVTGLIWLLSRWCKLLAWQQVADLYRVSWSTVAGAVKAAVKYGLEHREMEGFLYIGIDVFGYGQIQNQ